MSVTEFRNNDKAYIKWSYKYKNGFVLNISRSLNLTAFKNMMLHKPLCPHIFKYDHRIDRHSGFTGNHLKIGANTINELEEWLKKQGCSDGISRYCQHCQW